MGFLGGFGDSGFGSKDSSSGKTAQRQGSGKGCGRRRPSASTAETCRRGRVERVWRGEAKGMTHRRWDSGVGSHLLLATSSSIQAGSELSG